MESPEPNTASDEGEPRIRKESIPSVANANCDSDASSSDEKESNDLNTDQSGVESTTDDDDEKTHELTVCAFAVGQALADIVEHDVNKSTHVQSLAMGYWGESVVTDETFESHSEIVSTQDSEHISNNSDIDRMAAAEELLELLVDTADGRSDSDFDRDDDEYGENNNNYSLVSSADSQIPFGTEDSNTMMAPPAPKQSEDITDDTLQNMSPPPDDVDTISVPLNNTPPVKEKAEKQNNKNILGPNRTRNTIITACFLMVVVLIGWVVPYVKEKRSHASSETSANSITTTNTNSTVNATKDIRSNDIFTKPVLIFSPTSVPVTNIIPTTTIAPTSSPTIPNLFTRNAPTASPTFLRLFTTNAPASSITASPTFLRLFTTNAPITNAPATTLAPLPQLVITPAPITAVPPIPTSAPIGINPILTEADRVVWSVLVTILPNPAWLLEPSTAHSRTFIWLTQKDGNQQYQKIVQDLLANDLATLNLNNNALVVKLVQRYIVALMDFSMHQLTNVIANATVDECQWIGITCTATQDSGSSVNVVDKIVWSKMNLAGTIPSEIGSLSHLSYVDLGENNLSGPIPEPLYDLYKLKKMFLHSNRLTGTLSTKIGQLQKLEMLYLGSNQLQGTIPQEMGSSIQGTSNARPLKFINLYNNSFSGTLPSNMNLGYLFYLDLGYNQLGGRIPVDWVDGINAMSSLRILYMNNNQFTGYLPQYFPSIGNGRLETFAINDNQFTGSFEFLTNYTERDFMAVLEINNNQFTAISEDVCNLSIFAGGQMTSFQADCEICSCASLCSTDYCVI